MIKAKNITNTMRTLSISLVGDRIYSAKPVREPEEKPYLYIDVIDGPGTRSDRGTVMRQAIVFVTSVSERDKDNEAVIQDLTQKIVTEGCTHIYDRDGVTVENVEEGTASGTGYTGTLPTQQKQFTFTYHTS